MQVQTPSNAPAIPGLANLPKPLAGENFRSYICRWISLQPISKAKRREVRAALLNHFRSVGMDVEASAFDCVAAINMHRYGVEQ